MMKKALLAVVLAISFLTVIGIGSAPPQTCGQPQSALPWVN